MIELSYVSLFSGIEAFSVAASRVEGVRWHPVFFSEIDPFPCAVLAHHFPTVPNLGDITKIRITNEPDTNARLATNGRTTVDLPRTGIDILAGGSPCQDVSVAGKRAGMAKDSGSRSALAFEYARLVKELRLRVILWENVGGVLSSNRGLDFAAFLNSLVERGYSLAYRVLDAQYTVVDGFPRAVPQRRRRVWLVGCLGADESVPAQILFERPCVLGNTPPRREAGQGFAAPLGYCASGDDRVVGGAEWVRLATATARSIGNGQLNNTEPEEVAKTLDTMHDAQAVCIGKAARGRTDRTSGSSCAFDAESLRILCDFIEDEFGGTDCATNEGERYDDLVVRARDGCDLATLEKLANIVIDELDGTDREEIAVARRALVFCGKVAVQGMNCLTPGHPLTHRVYGEGGAWPTLPANDHGGQNQQAVLASTALNPLDPQSKRVFTGDMAAPTLASGNREGGNIQPSVLVSNSNGGQNQRATPVESASFDGEDVSATLHKPNGAPGYSDQELFAQQGAFLARCLDMTHADEVIREVEGDAAPTMQSCMGTGGNQVPLILMAYNPPIQDIIAEVCKKYDAAWPEDEWVDITDEVTLNIYIDMDCKRRATAFQNSDENLEFGVDIAYVGDAVEFVVEPSVCKTLSAEGYDGMPDPAKGNGMPVVAVGFSHVASGMMLDCQLSPTSIPLKRSPGGENAAVIGVKYLASEKSREPTSVNVSQALGAGRNDQGVAVGIDGYNQSVTGDIAVTISGAASDFHHTHGVALRHIVRRLTPTECSRLQGFPDQWCRIPMGKWRKIDEAEADYLRSQGAWVEPHIRPRKNGGTETDLASDSPMYKADGNSMATNCMEWVLRRIVAAIRLGLIDP